MLHAPSVTTVGWGYVKNPSWWPSSTRGMRPFSQCMRVSCQQMLASNHETATVRCNFFVLPLNHWKCHESLKWHYGSPLKLKMAQNDGLCRARALPLCAGNLKGDHYGKTSISWSVPKQMTPWGISINFIHLENLMFPPWNLVVAEPMLHLLILKLQRHPSNVW